MRIPVTVAVSAAALLTLWPAGSAQAQGGATRLLAQAPPEEREIQLEREHPLEVMGLPTPEAGGFRLSGFFVGSASYNSHIQIIPEFAGGAPSLADPGSVNFRFDKFVLVVSETFAPWLSAGAAVEIAARRVSAASVEMRGGRPVVAAYAVEALPEGALVPSLISANT